MGYYTEYTLEHDGGYDPAVEESVRKIEYYGDTLADGHTTEGTKWYDHEKDMVRVSVAHPSVLFTLHGVGEGSYDIWKKYFRNGKMQVAKAEITFADPEI